MIFVPIPKDLTNVKTKVAFNLTGRQNVCFGIAFAIAIPAFILIKDIVGNQMAVLVVMALAAPFIYFANYEKDGLSGEKYLLQLIDFKLKRTFVRTYKNTNMYHTINDIEKLDKQFERKYHYQKLVENKKKK